MSFQIQYAKVMRVLTNSILRSAPNSEDPQWLRGKQHQIYVCFSISLWKCVTFSPLSNMVTPHTNRALNANHLSTTPSNSNSFKHSFFLSESAHWIELSSEMTSLAVFKMIIHAALNPSFVFAVVAVVWLLSVATELNMYVVWPQDL